MPQLLFVDIHNVLSRGIEQEVSPQPAFEYHQNRVLLHLFSLNLVSPYTVVNQ